MHLSGIIPELLPGSRSPISPFLSRFLLASLTFASAALADQGELVTSGNSTSPQYRVASWPQEPCSQTCTLGNQRCVDGGCLPFISIQASYRNRGGTTITGGIPYSHFEEMVKRSLSRWTSAQVKSCTTLNELAGFTTVSSPQGNAAFPGGRDQINMVGFLEGTEWSGSSQTLGYTQFWAFGTEIAEADIVLNGNVQWFEGTPTASDQQKTSLESVLTHEAGHFFGIQHTTYRPGAIMHPITMRGTHKITLDLADEEDICGLYPPKTPVFALGCGNQQMCGSSLTCLAMQDNNRRSICTTTCATDADCSSRNYKCLSPQGARGCFLPSRPTDFCLTCQTGADCQSGICAQDYRGVKYCSTPCVLDNDCKVNERCRFPSYQVGNSVTLACSPIDMSTCGVVCTSDAQCSTGARCSAGKCITPSREGENCAANGLCENGLVCSSAGGATTATCRTCCGGSCSSGAISTCNGSCVADTKTSAQVCIPGTKPPDPVPDAGTNTPDTPTNPPDAGTKTPDAPTIPPDAGTNTPDAGTNPPDAGPNTPEAPTKPPDAGTNTPDGSINFPPDASTNPPAPGSDPKLPPGCGCASTGPESSLWLLSVLPWIAWRRRFFM